MRIAGITLWELLVTLAVAGLGLVVAVPGLERFALDARRTAEVNAFVGAVQLARSEAYAHGRPVVLCKTADRRRCGGREIRYDAGWMVFTDTEEASPPERGKAVPVLYAHVPPAGTRIASNRRLFEFFPFRHRSTNGTVTFCDRRGAEAARAVIVSYTGRPRTASQGPGGRPLACGR